MHQHSRDGMWWNQDKINEKNTNRYKRLCIFILPHPELALLLTVICSTVRQPSPAPVWKRSVININIQLGSCAGPPNLYNTRANGPEEICSERGSVRGVSLRAVFSWSLQVCLALIEQWFQFHKKSPPQAPVWTSFRHYNITSTCQNLNNSFRELRRTSPGSVQGGHCSIDTHLLPNYLWEKEEEDLLQL